MKVRIREYFHKNNIFKISSVSLTIIAIVLVILAIIPVHFGGDNNSEEVMIRNGYEAATINKNSTEIEASTVSVVSFTKDSNTAISELISNYYSALISNDNAQLSKYTDDVEAIDSLKRLINSAYVEEYQNLECYIMPGLLDNTYIVAAVSYIKYRDIDTVAANMDYFYICKDISNNMYISNKEAGEDVTSYNDMMYASNTIIEISSKVAQEYDNAVKSDVKLYNLFTSFNKL